MSVGRRRVMVPAIVAAAALGVGCRPAAESPAEHPVAVRTARVESGRVTEWVRLYGRVVPPPDRDATLAPLVPGALVEVPVREGQAVKAGETLARVEPAALDDALRAAEAAQRRAASEAEFRKRAAERTRTLVDRGVASRQEAEADEAGAVAAEAALAEAVSAAATARRRRGWADVRAPFDGVVVRVLRRAGDTVDGTPATPVVQVASPAGAQVAADATAAVLARVEPGQAATVEPAASGHEPPAPDLVPARVLRTSRAVDSATGTGEVRLAFDGPRPAGLTLGTSVGARIGVRSRDGATVVPARALRRDEEGHTEAVVVENGKAVVRRVTTGIADGDRVEVVDGLAAGETVVVDDPVGLAEGTPLAERP